jgi:hypothetical protein
MDVVIRQDQFDPKASEEISWDIINGDHKPNKEILSQ